MLYEDLSDKWQVSVEQIDMRDLNKLESALKQKTKLILFLLFDCALDKKAQQELRPPARYLMHNNNIEVVLNHIGY